MDDWMRGRWVNLCNRLFYLETPTWARDVAVGWHIVLEGLYQKRPGREYHNTFHIRDLLSRLSAAAMLWGTMKRADSGKISWDRAELAIWFHDAIYQAGQPGCEEASADLARNFIRSMGGEQLSGGGLLQDVVDIIQATRHDGTGPRDATTNLVLDLDLAGFADPWQTFDARNDDIRSEFAHVPDPLYSYVRLKFLAGLMSRPAIYRVLTELEAPARANITRHMAELAMTNARAMGDDGGP
jgi:predicted metal-dependent HD superfamily phosphohydrolase